MNKRLPSLDGWRAVSIALVLLGHGRHSSGFPAILFPIEDLFAVSNVGVRFFFVISGFLITWLLLQEGQAKNCVSLKHFYIRRALRILPVYSFFLLTLGCFTHFSQSKLAWIANVTFTTNYINVAHATQHLWSLGVEEQFYLIWPALLILTVKHANGSRRMLKILSVPILVAPVVRLIESKRYFPALHFLTQGGSFFSKCDSLALGCVAAILLFYHYQRLKVFFLNYFNLAICGALILLLLPALFHVIHVPGRLQAAFGDSIQAVGFVILLLQSILHPEIKFYRLLNWRLISHVGVLSYSIYIWQQMFFDSDNSVFAAPGVWWLRFPTWVILALFVAHLSYYLLEKPLFRLRAFFRD